MRGRSALAFRTRGANVVLCASLTKVTMQRVVERSARSDTENGLPPGRNQKMPDSRQFQCVLPGECPLRDVRKLDACNGPHKLDSFGVLRDSSAPVQPVATMQTKTLPPIAPRPYEISSDATFLQAKLAPETSTRIVAQLSALRSTLRERQTDLGAQLAEPAAVALPSPTAVEKQLIETARVVAELLALAERANEGSRPARASLRGKQSMRVLADACFDAILRIDAARHELHESMAAQAPHQRRHRREILRRAQKALTKVERQLAHTLSNSPRTSDGGLQLRMKPSATSGSGPSAHARSSPGRNRVRIPQSYSPGCAWWASR